MKRLPIILAFLLLHIFTAAQSQKAALSHSKIIDSINRLIDQAVVEKQMQFLQKHYAADFVFTHGTGQIDSKESWLKNVTDTSVHFIMRRHDSTQVELHHRMAIITGTLTVHRRFPYELSRYALRYVRVYVLRKKTWQLVSHRTTQEWHL